MATALIWFWVKRGLFEEGRRWLELALAQAGPGILRARALMGREHMHYWQGRGNDSSAMHEALVLGREHGDPWSTSFALFARALVDFDGGLYDSATARALAAREADATGEAVPNRAALLVLGNVALVRGDPTRALDLFDESIVLHRRFADAWGLSILLTLAAGLRLQRGEFHEARAEAAEALSLCEALDDPRGMAYGLATMGGSLVPTMRWIRAHYLNPWLRRPVTNTNPSPPRDEPRLSTTRSRSRVRASDIEALTGTIGVLLPRVAWLPRTSKPGSQLQAPAVVPP